MKLRLAIILIFASFLIRAKGASVIDSHGETNVELSSFQVNDMETKVALSWATISEKNANHIFVERSVDGKKWVSVGKIKAAENSDHTLYYEYFDEAPLKGISYYRLRIEGMDKDLEYSEMKVVERSKEIFVIVYPNSLEGYLNLASSYNVNDLAIELFDPTGKQVVVIGEVVSEEKMVFDISDLAKGIYSVNVKSIDGKPLSSQKITLK